MKQKFFEVNFDGLVGNTHNYAGLAFGNVASINNQQQIANPKEAALQGLAKMRLLMSLGIKQGVLPPQQRPAMWFLRQIGFSGSDEKILKDVFKHHPKLLSTTFSASSMWTANAATISPSPDTDDGKVHVTPANLVSNLHRSLEWPTTQVILKRIFHAEKHFVHHDPLPLIEHFSDEGAANHTRLCQSDGMEGVEFFVYGRYALVAKKHPKRYPARQTFEASTAIARLHQLKNSKTIFAQQNPQVIDQGVFHNDVISVGNGNVLLFHEEAFLQKEKILAEIEQKFSQELYFLEIKQKDISVEDAVSSYLFNSQLVTMPNNDMAIIAPIECFENARIKDVIKKIIEDKNPVKHVHYIDCRQSMRNGGGPACLRLRVVLNEQELNGINQAVILDEEKISQLEIWVEKNYRESLAPGDLLDPALIQENYRSLDELTQILELGSIYPFQRI